MLVYDYQIPDLTRPIHVDSPIAPSGELIDFLPGPLDTASLVSRRVDDYLPHIGTYGMGGPGFFGLQLGAEWLVIAIWGAPDWILFEGRCVGDPFHKEHGRSPPWLDSDQASETRFRAKLVGQRISDVQLAEKSLRIDLDGGSCLQIEEDPAARPILQGTRQPRVFKPDDDLRRAVFMSPTTEIWV